MSIRCNSPEVVDCIFLESRALIGGWGTCGTFQSFPVISAEVPCTYYVYRDIIVIRYLCISRYVHVP